jgi:hypothetical protein
MVYAVALVKDEADIIAETVGWMVRQVDKVIVADNGSTDGTLDILRDLDVTLIEDPEVGYYQSRKMTRLAELCREAGAEWVVPFDADEVHVPRTGRIADQLRSLPADVLVSEAPLFDHVVTGRDPDGPTVQRMGYRRAAPAPLRKVAVRAVEGVVIHQGNHSAEFPAVTSPQAVTNIIQVRHFPYRSVEQFVKKVRNGAAAYAATTLSPEAGAHWRQYGAILDSGGEEAIAEIFDTWFRREDPDAAVLIGTESQPPLVYDPCPG